MAIGARHRRGGENGRGGTNCRRANLYRSPRPHGASRSAGARDAEHRCHWAATDGVHLCAEHRLWPTSPGVPCYLMDPATGATMTTISGGHNIDLAQLVLGPVRELA